HLIGHRHVIELVCHLVPFGVGPGKELECFHGRGGILRLLVDQDPGGRGHWPSGGTGLVGQDDAITGLGVPVGIGAGGLGAVRAWGHDLTVLVHHLGIGEFVLFGIGVLDIANRALGLGDVVGNALVALGAEPTRPLDRVVGSNLGLPVGADLGQ